MFLVACSVSGEDHNSGNIIAATFEGNSFIRLYLGKTQVFEYQSDTIISRPYLCRDEASNFAAIFFSEKDHYSDRESYYAITPNKIGSWQINWLSAQDEEFEEVSESTEQAKKLSEITASHNYPESNQLEVALFRKQMISDLVYQINADIAVNHPALLNITAN